MSREEYDDWRKANDRTAGEFRADRPCIDCPRWFRDEALAERRCNGALRRAPRATAKPSKHPPVRLLQWREAQQRKRDGIRIRRSSAEVDALRHAVIERRKSGARWAQIGRELEIDPKYVRQLWTRAA